MIGSFGSDGTEDLFHGIRSKRASKIPADIVSVALRKLDMINSATRLDDLKTPPGNKLEKLIGNLEGFHSIRVNDQYRIIFKWTEGIATEVEITDYH